MSTAKQALDKALAELAKTAKDPKVPWRVAAHALRCEVDGNRARQSGRGMAHTPLRDPSLSARVVALARLADDAEAFWRHCFALQCRCHLTPCCPKVAALRTFGELICCSP